jgi:hypothetical protein
VVQAAYDRRIPTVDVMGVRHIHPGDLEESVRSSVKLDLKLDLADSWPSEMEEPPTIHAGQRLFSP